jgi:hypothetical protein
MGQEFDHVRVRRRGIAPLELQRLPGARECRYREHATGRIGAE